MKVLYFLDSLQMGGRERRALELMHYLKSNGAVEMLLVLTDDDIYYKSVYELGIKIEVLKRRVFKRDPLIFFRFLSSCRRFKPDIIHAWSKMTTFYALPAKVLYKIPLISNLISDTFEGYRKYSLDWLFFIADIHFSDVILSNSKSGLNAYGIISAKAKVIHNGVRLERFYTNFDREKVRNEIGVDTTYIVIMVASFSKNKDYDLFIDIARYFQKIRSDVTFIAVGDGVEWNRIKKRTEDENLHNVILTGMRRDVEPIIAASDIGILCTYSEGISNSIIEYMALGKPVISTDLTGGSREIIIDGETGFCVGRDPEKIIELILILLGNRDLRYSLGEKGKKRINSLFTIDKMGSEFKALYEKVLNDSKGSQNIIH